MMLFRKKLRYRDLDIQVSEKKIREFGFEIATKTQVYEKALADLEARKSDLDAKKAELGTITAETQKEENELTTQAEKANERY